MGTDMADEAQDLIQEQKIEHPVIEPMAVAPTPKKPNKNLWIVLGIVTALICICSCAILCVALGAAGVGQVMVETVPVTAVLDSFMKDMEAKDVESAYALFSPRSQRQTPITDLETMDQGNNYVLFEGYKSLSIQNLNLTATVNTNPDLPQGTVAKVEATVTYQDGFTGRITAVLEKVDGTWKIFNINVTVPPDKFQP
jgi:hypothetical protein